jgi:hypothetical protein
VKPGTAPADIRGGTAVSRAGNGCSSPAPEVAGGVTQVSMFLYLKNQEAIEKSIKLMVRSHVGMNGVRLISDRTDAVEW